MSYWLSGLTALSTAMEVHPQGSPLSCQDSGRPGESCGVCWSVSFAFNDITTFHLCARFAFQGSQESEAQIFSCIEELLLEGVTATHIPGMEQDVAWLHNHQWWLRVLQRRY